MVREPLSARGIAFTLRIGPTTKTGRTYQFVDPTKNKSGAGE
jgi:hypothetical protein